MDAQLLTPDEFQALIHPKLLHPLPAGTYAQLALYMELLYRWNRQMNLTAVRDPKIMASLHIAESLRCSQLLPQGVRTVLDFGSGAGLPGIPIQIARPELAVTLAESQTKKAGFLREALRVLGLTNASVYAGRVEDLPNCSTWNNLASGFDLVTLRAVDRMKEALQKASQCARAGGWIAVLTSAAEIQAVKASLPTFDWGCIDAIPGTEQRVILVGCKAKEDRREIVPRGTI